MNTDTASPPAGFHGRLLTRLREFLAGTPGTPFSEVSIETSVEGRRADILVEGRRTGSLAIGVRRDTVNPRAREAIASARDRAAGLGADLFATCNSNDLFLFDRRGGAGTAAPDYHYLDLRPRPLADAVPTILEAADRRYREGRFPDQPRRARLVGTLRSFHSSTWPAFRAAAGDAYAADRQFAEAFDEWVRRNDYRDRERPEQFEIAAKQYAYLLTNWALFHEVRRRQSGPGGEDPSTAGIGFPLGRLGRAGEEPSPRRFEGYPEDACGIPGVDRGPAPATGSELFESFPHTEGTRRSVARLVRDLESDPTAGIDGDLLGGIYEDLIPERERRALGQFYTPPAIAETLVRWALRPGADNRGTGETDTIPRVLDPASGSGTFAVEAYRYLAEQFPGASHQELVDHVLAVDVNRFPLHLTALNLASRQAAERTERVNAYHASFFDLDPATDSLAGGRIDALAGGDGGGEIGTVDAVVGNPPYIEAGDLHPTKEHFRSHLEAFGAGYRDGANGIGKNADAYVYFVTHATRFLREGGRLGFVLPTKWMMSRYGEQFQRFLFDHYKLEAVVGFDARAFGDALVDTALVLLERCADGGERRDNVAEFVQLHDTVSPGDLLGTIDRGHELPDGDELTVTGTADARTVGVRQSYLEDGAEYGKIAHYLVAPEDLIEVVESPELASLGEMADVTRGAMTGSTAFFFPDAEDVEAHGIEDEFLSPALKSVRGHDEVRYTGDDVGRWFVDVHEYVEGVRDRPGNGSLEAEVKSALEADGYDGLRSWIRHAEKEGEHRGATCQEREVWFDFGEPPRPEILFQKLLRERLFSVYNEARAVPSNAVDCIDVRPGVDPKVLFGVLNSSIVRAIMEVWGRNEAGMLQLMTYETRSLPVPDIRAMGDGERERIVAAVDAILERGTSDIPDGLRDRLDAAVLATLDLPAETTVDRIQDVQGHLLNRRVESGGTIEVLMDDAGPRSVKRE